MELQLLETISSGGCMAIIATVCFFMFFCNVMYNLCFHPLAGVPGPLLARASGFVSYYYATQGDRHIWIKQLFEIYGNRVRVAPGVVLFLDPQAAAEIYGNKSNVRRSPFYTAWKRTMKENSVMNSIEVEVHARKRKMLNLAFSEKSTRSAAGFIIQHIDRLHHLLEDQYLHSDQWSSTIDFSRVIDSFTFDVMGDLAFGRSFDIKEPGANPLKEVPDNIVEYMKFYYPMCRSPWLGLLLWLKPRGLDALFEIIAPESVKRYKAFVQENLKKRLALQREQIHKPEAERRQDLFYFLASAVDPETGASPYSESDLFAESSLLILAGTSTTSVSLSSTFFYLSRDAQRCQKAVREITTVFQSPEDIVYGSKLSSCTYLRACIDEAMRLTPSGPCELPREVLPGGLIIKGELYPAGTIVGTLPWANGRNKNVYEIDADAYRPERWIVDEGNGVTKEMVSQIRSAFHPFLTGPGHCVGQHLAVAEMMLFVAKTLYRFEIRSSPRSNANAGWESHGLGGVNKHQMQVKDAFISLVHDPELQIRKRTVS